MKKISSGFNLIELTIVISMMAVVVSLSAPLFSDVVKKNSQQQLINQLYHQLQLARNTAATHQQIVTFCSTSNGIDCDELWDSQTMVFIDLNKNEKLDHADTLVSMQPINLVNALLKVSTGLGLKFFQFMPSGLSNGKAGHICYKDLSRGEFVQAIVINFQGRIRLAKQYHSCED